MAQLRNAVQNLLENLLYGKESSPDIFADGADSLPSSDEFIVSLNLSENDQQTPAAVKLIPAPAETAQKDILSDMTSSGIAVIELGGSGALSRIERKLDIRTLRNYAKNSVWVRAAIDYHRRMLGRAKFELVPLDSTKDLKRIDKFVKKEIEHVLRHPNAAEESYNTLKEQFVEDYLVLGAGCLELDLNRDLTPRGLRIIDAANIGFVRAWNGTDNSIPRYVEFKDGYSSRVKRYLAHEQLMCLVNRPTSDSKLGFSHVEVLHRTVIALLSGDEFLIKQILQPIPDTLVSLGEGVSKTQVDDFKYQLQQVRDKLAVIGGTKSAQVLRLSASNDEMKILDGQVWFVRQVAAVFGMSTAKLKLAVDTSRANTETMMDDDLEAVTGELTRIEELETATFINRFSYLGDINLQFFYPIMHRKDEQTQARIAAMQLRGQSWASTNEARMRTGEKPLDQNEFPYADEPLVITKDGPVPMSVWQKWVEKYAAGLDKPEEGKPDDSASEEKTDEETGSGDENNK